MLPLPVPFGGVYCCRTFWPARSTTVNRPVTGLGQIDGGLPVRAYGQVHRAAGLFDAVAGGADELVLGVSTDPSV